MIYKMLTERISDVKFATPPPFRPPPDKYTKINTYTKTILWTIVLHGLFRECSVGRHLQSAICWGLSPCQRMVSLVSDWRFLGVECVGVTWQEGYHDEQFTRLHCQIWQPLSFGLFKLPAINLKGGKQWIRLFKDI